MSIRILSYNIHKGFSLTNQRYLLDEIRHSIRLVKADLVLLQEVVGENRKNHQRIHNWAPQQFEYLADEVWPHYAYGKNAIYSHGHHGNAILSQYPFRSWRNIDVSLVPTSQRGILHGETEHGLHVSCVHFGLFGFERQKQIRQLCQLIAHDIPPDAPLVIAGDFNDWLGRSHDTLTKTAGLKEAIHQQHHRIGKTFPARFPMLAMDRIYYRGLTLLDAEVLSGHPWNTLSDHCALYAEFA